MQGELSWPNPLSSIKTAWCRPFLELVRQNTPPRQEKAASEIGFPHSLGQLGFECRYDDAGEKVGGTVGNLIAFKQGTLPQAPGDFLFVAL